MTQARVVMAGSGTARRARWSRPLTAWLAGRISVAQRPLALKLIKGAHTVIFCSVASLIVLFTWDGARRRPSRRTTVAAVIALSETAVYASNNLVCPLTPLAEELGAVNGSATDMLLPVWLSRRIPLIFGSLLAVGIVLNVRSSRAHRPGRMGPTPLVARWCRPRSFLRSCARCRT